MRKLIPMACFLIISFASIASAQTQTGYCPYDPKIVPPKNLGEFSRTFRTFIAEVGTDGTFYIPVSTTAVTGSDTTGRVGTATARDLSLPMFGWNGSAWVFKPAGSTSAWQTVGSLTPGSMSAYILNTNGTGTGFTGTNTTLNGTTTIDASGVVIANGRSLSPVEVSYLDGLSDFLTTLLAAKQSDLGGTYIASVSNDVGTATGAIRIKGTGDIEVLKVGTNLFNINLAGTPTAKPDIKEGGTTTVSSATNIDFDETYFDVTADGGGADIDFTESALGTSTAGASKLVRSGIDGKIEQSWFISGTPVKFASTGTNTAKSLGTIPDDDTPPEITEGTEILSISYSAANANNWLVVEAIVNVTIGGSDSAAGIGALFQTGTANAFAANRMRPASDASTNKDLVVPIKSMPFQAGTTTAQTITLRGGSPSGTARTISASVDGNRKLGGSIYNTLTITEYAP